MMSSNADTASDGPKKLHPSASHGHPTELNTDEQNVEGSSAKSAKSTFTTSGYKRQRHDDEDDIRRHVNVNVADDDDDDEEDQHKLYQANFWEQRRLLYGIYKSTEDMRVEMDRYGVVDVDPEKAIIRLRPPQKQKQRKPKTSGDEQDADTSSPSFGHHSTTLNTISTEDGLFGSSMLLPSVSGTIPNPAAPAEVPVTGHTTATSTSIGGRGKDIWGNFPVKEPKEMIPCPMCHRSVGVLRFAPHLDKCMGLGNTTRGGVAAVGVANPAIPSNSNHPMMTMMNHPIHNNNNVNKKSGSARSGNTKASTNSTASINNSAMNMNMPLPIPSASSSTMGRPSKADNAGVAVSQSAGIAKPD